MSHHRDDTAGPTASRWNTPQRPHWLPSVQRFVQIKMSYVTGPNAEFSSNQPILRFRELLPLILNLPAESLTRLKFGI